MSRLAAKFNDLASRGEKALVLFVTGGDPELEQLPYILDALAEGGADLIEVGLPFSDPIADGPTIQASSQRALDRGITPKRVIEACSGFERVPLVAMGYYNTVLRQGEKEFADLLAKNGFSGTIISDLTPEESGSWIVASQAAGLDNVFLVAPTSTPERLRLAAGASSGFVYAVSRTGVTGAGNQVPASVSELVSSLQAVTTHPICVGFGISTAEHVSMVCEHADGAVVGSWLVNELADYWKGGEGRETLIEKVKALKAATKAS